MLFDLLGGRSLHADPRVGAPEAYLREVRLVDPLHPDTGGLPSTRHEWSAGHFPFPRLVRKPVTRPELHWEDADCGGLRLRLIHPASRATRQWEDAPGRLHPRLSGA